jgi:hypothetical protein
MGSFASSWPPEDLQQNGPWIRLAVGHPQIERDEGRVVGLEFPAPLIVNALIDTGSSITVINPELAITHKLRQTGFAEVSAVGSSGRYPEYAAALSFPGTTLPGLDPVKVVACSLFKQPVSCLVGRDMLKRWVLLYNGPAGQIRIDG